MKKGDCIIGPSIKELLKTEVCHKCIDNKIDSSGYIILCDVKKDSTTIVLSHNDWDMVNCPNCIALRYEA